MARYDASTYMVTAKDSRGSRTIGAGSSKAAGRAMAFHIAAGTVSRDARVTSVRHAPDRGGK